MDLGLRRGALAARWRVRPGAIKAWEANREEPGIQRLPEIIEFLGYVPFPEPKTLAEALLLYRQIHGMKQLELARKLQISSRTIWEWEKGVCLPAECGMGRVRDLLKGVPGWKG